MALRITVKGKPVQLSFWGVDQPRRNIGDYEIRHTMKGEEHIMVFHQIHTAKPIEVSAKCTLVPLPKKASDTQKSYVLNAANERVLHELVFKGDNAKHVF